MGSLLIDVLLPFHQENSYLYEAIDSVMSSKSVDIRLILIDDRAKEQQLSLQEFDLKGQQTTRVHTAGLAGYANALKTGLEISDSSYIALMNSDDLVSPDRFQKQMESLGDGDISICGIQRMRSDGRLSTSIIGAPKMECYQASLLTLGSYGANATWLATRDWWKTYFFSDTHACLDWRIALNSFSSSKIGVNSENLYFYRRHGSQISQLPIPKDDLELIFESWKSLLPGKYQDFDFFMFLAVPFMKHKFNNLKTVLMLAEDFVNDIEKFGIDESNRFLIQRRFLLALRQNHTSLANILVCLKNGGPALRVFLRDLARYV